MRPTRESVLCASAGCRSEATTEFVINESARLPRCPAHAAILRRLLTLNSSVRWRAEEIERR